MITPVSPGDETTIRTQSAQSAQKNERKWSSLRPLRALRSLVLSLAVGTGWSASAHDLENTNVLLAFERDGSFVLDVANDPSWLKLRLERFPGSFADRIVLWVDGHEVRPASVELIPGPTVATYRLRGRMPPGARTLRWYYGLVIDPYPLAVRRADGRVVIEEIAGDAWSSPIDLTGQFHAPLLDQKVVGILLVGLLLVPLALRLGLRRGSNTKDTEDTEVRTRHPDDQRVLRARHKRA
jgi:hypothetical protein